MKPKIYSSTFRYENIHDRDQGGGGTQQSFIRGGEALLRGPTALTAVNALSLK